tara:strand:+ start:474 stop:986 length:513 start_codon:yes stop_codon:yes gene_type:complete
MRQVTNPNYFRNNVKNELMKLVNNENICKNMEKGILNYCVNKATEQQIVKKWNNVYFTQLYIDRLRMIIINLKNNPELRNRVAKKAIQAHKIAFMTHQEMKPQKWKQLIDAKKIRDNNLYSPKVVANTDNFVCRKCKSRKCSYYQLQTRSADEPMTTFVTCIDCGNRWKC